ncbi:MAG: hypothetical protein L7T84_13145 [Akkermansiaceae bacterium]|nr:hypothetical protein [Akkermansiaceae bacterium]
MLKYFFWSWLVSFSCQGQEKEKVTQTRDKLTLDKARVALAESKKGPGEIFVPLFDLPKSVQPEIIDTKLTYQKALEALKREDLEIKKLSALIREKRSLLAKMIGNTFREDDDGKMRLVPNPPYTEKQYDEAKAVYERAQEELWKAKASGDKRVLFKKSPKK